jgi:hypothetical protein
MMQPQYPDDRFPLTQYERDEFRRIWQGLAGPEESLVSAEDPADPRPGLSVMTLVCVVGVFIGLAADSVFLVLLATVGAVGAHLARNGYSLVQRRARDDR